MEAGFASRAEPMTHLDPTSKLRAEHHQQLPVQPPLSHHCQSHRDGRSLWVGDVERNNA